MIQLKSGPIDFVLSDIRLPGKSGIELLKFVQNLPEPRPQVVLLTGFTDLSEEEGLALGAKALIRKPIELEKVFRVIDQLRQSK
jgi:CheY-like chemotaxis protein